MRQGPSPRLRWLLALSRTWAQSQIARLDGPEDARRMFDAAARYVLKRPGHLRHMVDAEARPPMHWFSCGPARSRGVILYFHGGGYVCGGSETHAGVAGRLSALTGCAVALPDYRLAPEHPAPAAFDDARAAHAALLAGGVRADEIVLAGDSAGGGLALALLADLCRRGLRPAGVVAFSPWTDLTLSGASIRENARADPLLPADRLPEAVGLVIGTLSADDPRVSPVMAEFDAPPPVLIQVGDTEILRDDAVRMGARLRAAGGAVRVDIWPRAPHAWPLLDGWFPEAREALVEAADFIAGVLPEEPPRSPARPMPPGRSSGGS